MTGAPGPQQPAHGLLAELVSLPTSDIPLDGLWYPPPSAPRSAVMLMHGNGGNFYSGPVRFLPRHLVPRGLACFAFNRRGHDTLTARTRDPEGNAFQTADQTKADNLTARRFVAARGFPSPVVIGHSNGGLYAARHVADHADVRALVLLSAHCGGPEMLALASALGLLAQDRHAELASRARELVAAGRPDALMLMPGWWYLTSAASYLDMERNVPRILEAAAAIRCPVLYLRGELEDPGLYPAEAFAAHAAGPVDVRIVPGADHFYTGLEDQVGRTVADWLDTVLSGAPRCPRTHHPREDSAMQPSEPASGAQGRAEVRDGMRIDWQVPIPADDGLVLRADVYRPDGSGKVPAIVSYGPYAKGLPFADGYAPQWEKLVTEHPDVAEGSSTRYQCWEVADPEKWVPFGYACVRVDSRGAGWSPGIIDVWSRREAEDLATCIEWAAAQPWCSGKVGLSGISYYAMNQWQVAALSPPHLAAMIPWEGAADHYRDVTHHGGIISDFAANWYERQVTTVQHGLGRRSAVNPITGEHVGGPEDLGDEELRRNRTDLGAEIRERPLDGPWYRERSADWERVTVPFLSAANWGGQGLHPRGNIEAFTQAASTRKWLEVHGAEHWTHYYTSYGIDLQRRFFDHFLRGIENGWERTAPVRLNIRHPGEHFELREEREWPLARTRWTRMYLDADSMALRPARPAESASVSYAALGDGVDFALPASEEAMELTGPLATRIFLSSSTDDVDLFLVLRLFAPDGEEVTFQGALDPNTPIAQGWLRASHRRLDPDRSLPYRPYHPHDAEEFLVPGEVVQLDVEIWPTCIVVPAGHRVVLSVRGKDYEYQGKLSPFAEKFYYAGRGVGPFTHTTDRPAERYGGTVTIHTGPVHPSFLLLPVIPPAP